MSDLKLQASNIHKSRLARRNDGGPQLVEVLRGLDFAVRRGEVFSIIGPSGAGKSTLLRLVNRLEDPDDGLILLDDEPLTAIPVVMLRRRVGIVFQAPALFDGSVADNITFGPALHSRPLTDPLGMAREFLDQVGLDPDLASRSAEDLSAGQQQRVAIARALANGPDVLLLDEPTSALDPTSTTRILDLVRELNARLGLTVLFVTHAIEQAARVADRAMLLVDGRKIEEGPAQQLIHSPREEITRRFVAGTLSDDTKPARIEGAGVGL